jgi:hypothetical protein
MFLKKFIATASIIWAGLSTASAQYTFDISKDEKSGQTMFVGKCTFDDLLDEATFDWIKIGSDEYEPDPTTIDTLKKVLPSCQFVILMGTWCEDTQNLLPQLYKTMLLTHCYTNYKMYALDREKKSNHNEQEKYKVTKVPTIIISKNGVELGRIVENSQKTIEADLLNIINGKMAKTEQE